MAGKRNQKDVDAEIDLHGLTAEQLRIALQQRWPQWRGLRSVRIVHGQGTVLRPEIERWCAETGIPYLPDAHNAGALRIFPRERTLPDNALGNTLKESGLRLTPEQEAWLRNPAEMERARQEEGRRLQLEEQRARALEAARLTQRQRDDALWQAEISRLGVMDKKKGKEKDADKPRPPVILPAVQLKFQEGYWKAELSRVAETDTETLQVQKKTGLDKLAPPMMEGKPAAKPDEQRPRRRAPQRDVEAEQALFEAEMERLGDFGDLEMRRAKRE